MGNSNKPAVMRTSRDMDFVKPPGREDYLTLGEVCTLLKRDPSWIRKLEARNKIPRAHRVPMGALSVRLWSPKQVEEIRQVLSTMKRGRPRGKS